MIKNHFSRLVGERRTSVSAVARATGIRRGSLHALYHGTATRIDFGTIDRLCRHFRVSVGELLECGEADAVGVGKPATDYPDAIPPPIAADGPPVKQAPPATGHSSAG